MFKNSVKAQILENDKTNQNYINGKIKRRLKFGESVLPFSSESFAFLFPV
jgi:hypothetical protein